jgi:hypothetical protein
VKLLIITQLIDIKSMKKMEKVCNFLLDEISAHNLQSNRGLATPIVFVQKLENGKGSR